MPTLRQIKKETAKAFGVTISSMSGKSRRRHLVNARCVAIYIIRQKSSLSLDEIGQMFNRRHSTVLHAIGRVQRNRSLLDAARHVLNKIPGNSNGLKLSHKCDLWELL